MNKIYTNNIINLNESIDYHDKAMVQAAENELETIISLALKKEVQLLHQKQNLEYLKHKVNRKKHA